MFARLGRFAYRRRRLVVAVWALVFVAGIVFGTQVFTRTKSNLNGGAASESVQADRRLNDARIDVGQGGAKGSDFAAVVDGRPVDDPALQASITGVATQVRAVPGVLSVIEVYGTPQARPLCCRC